MSQNSTNTGSRFVRLFFSQLGYKVISFCATSLLTRALTPTARGVGFFFEMYFLAAGFLAREAIRSLHARVPLQSSLSRRAVRGSGLVCVLFALLVLVPLCAVHATLTAEMALLDAVRISSLPPVFSYLPVVLILAAALALDLLAESHFNLIIGSGSQGGIESRVRTESISLLCKTAAGAGVVYGNNFLFAPSQQNQGDDSSSSPPASLLNLAVVAFAAGHFAYGVTTWTVSCIELAKWLAGGGGGDGSASRSDPSLLWLVQDKAVCVRPSLTNIAAALTFYSKSTSDDFDGEDDDDQAEHDDPRAPGGRARRMRNITADDNEGGGGGNRALMSQFLQENVLRLFLTEGEKFVLSSSATVALSAQGAYDVATGIGALAARLLFRLWEEFSFNEWARAASTILAHESCFASSPTKLPRNDNMVREKKKQALAVLDESVALFRNMCRVAVVVGVLCCAFGPLLSGRVLWLLYGSRWANQEAASILAVFVCVLPLIGLNGLVEAFGRAMCSAAQLQEARSKLLIVSALYLASALAALVYSGGDVRFLIAANAGQFVLRIAIGLQAAKEVIDQKRAALLPLEGEQDAVHSPWGRFLVELLPSPVFLGVAVIGAAVGWAKMPPGFDEAGNYTSPLIKRDAVLIVVALATLGVAVFSEPEARSLIRGLMGRRKQD